MKVLIVYGSSKGRTGRIAKFIAGILQEQGINVTLKNVYEAKPEEISDYSCFILGSSTYGQGDLQQDFFEFERRMDDLDLTGKVAAVFGSGNSRYVYFSEAVDILEARIKILGARLLLPGLRQDMMNSSPEGEEVHDWGKSLVRALQNHITNSDNTQSTPKLS